MAKRNLKSSDIVAYLLQGGDISQLSQFGVSQKSLIGAFLSSPELVNKYRTQAKTEAEPYASFNPSYEYDPASNINQVESKYYAMPEKYATFAKDFWDQVKAVGSNAVEVSRINKDIDSKRDAYAASAGMTTDEFNELFTSLKKDVDNFQSAESAREKSQYSAFYKQRKELGITGEGQKATDEYLRASTGVAGLADLPTSVDEFVKQKSTKFLTGIKGKFSGKAEREYKQMFEDALKKKVGKNYQKYTVTDLLKKNFLGE